MIVVFIQLRLDILFCKHCSIVLFKLLFQVARRLLLLADIAKCFLFGIFIHFLFEIINPFMCACCYNNSQVTLCCDRCIHFYLFY